LVHWFPKGGKIGLGEFPKGHLLLEPQGTRIYKELPFLIIGGLAQEGKGGRKGGTNFLQGRGSPPIGGKGRGFYWIGPILFKIGEQD